MRKRTLYFLTIAVLFFGANVFVPNALLQTKPFTIGQILRAIASINQQTTDGDKKMYYSKILNDIRQRKVDFPLTKANEELLRNEGATDELIEVIRKNAPPLSASTLTPTPNLSTPTPIPTQTPKPVYLTYLEAGNKYFDEFNFARAIEEYNKVLELDPQNTDALIQRIYVRHYKADSDFGFADYTSAIKINPNLASEPSIICVLYDAPNNNADDIIENCNKAISAKPNFSLFYYKRANAYRQKQNYEQAITDYGKAIELYRNFYDAYLNRGQTFTDKEDYEKARADFSKAIEIDPKNAAAYYYRGLIYQKTHRKGSFNFFYLFRNEADYNQFRNDFSKAIELNPRLAVAYYNRGLLQPGFIGNRSSNFDPLLDFNKVIEIDPTFANAYFGRGLIYRLKGENNKAITEFTKAIELDPNLAAAYSERGFVYLLKKDCNRAILEFTKGIELDPSLSFAYDNRAECYMNKKDFDRALKDFDKLIELEPDRYPAYEKRASVYEKLGQKNLADQDRKKASEVKKAVLTNAQLNRNSTNPSIVSGGFLGQISDKNKKPIPGVTVTITNKNTGFSVFTKTNEKGTFSRNGLPPGRYEIKFSATGYKTLFLYRELFATRTNEIIALPVMWLEDNP